MTPQRRKDVLLAVSLLSVALIGVWLIVGREPSGSESPSVVRTVEAPAVNPQEKGTMPKEEEAVQKLEPTSQEAMLREENIRVMRDNAIRTLREGN